MPPEPTVLGVDLSLTGTGLALPDGTTRTISTKPADGTPLDRIRTIRNAVMTPALRERVDLVVLEDLSFGSKGSAVHVLAGLAYAIRLELDALCIPFTIVGAGQLKKYATGSGVATKDDIRMARYQRTGVDHRNYDENDAWWLRAMGMDHLGHPIVDVPKVHREVLAKVAWPNGVSHD